MLQASRGRGKTAASRAPAVAAEIRVVKPALHDARSDSTNEAHQPPQPRRRKFAALHVEPRHFDADLRKAVAHRTLGDQARHRTVPAAPHVLAAQLKKQHFGTADLETGDHVDDTSRCHRRLSAVWGKVRTVPAPMLPPSG